MAKTPMECLEVLFIGMWLLTSFFSILTMSKFKLKNMLVLSVPIANLFYFINEFEGIKNKLNPFHYFILGVIFWSIILFN
jgi:hypothetical protein